jgi:hypothetical protein
MLILTNTTDKIQVTTGTAADVDVHASWSDAPTPILTSSSVTPGRTNTAITTATTTDVVAAPAASTVRNVKTLHIFNKDTADTTDVTVIYDQSGTDFTIHKATLAPGEALEYVEGIGWYEIAASTAAISSAAATTSTIASHSADTYYLGMSCTASGTTRLQAGSMFRWKFRTNKTAGTATPTYIIRYGTAGTTADTARVTLTGAAQTAVADEGWVEIDAAFRTVGASATIVANHALFHRLGTTGLSVTAANVFMTPVVSGTFDSGVANSIIGLSVNPGASGAWVTDLVTLDASNLIR